MSEANISWLRVSRIMRAIGMSTYGHGPKYSYYIYTREGVETLYKRGDNSPIVTNLTLQSWLGDYLRF
jgi:hypothetical protein